eukprot:TRINITY_DN325_c0_g1_i10.p1 TRINITY_DN325_c0_g1~~TRINITY_DN325_c0_g1_i10.p1  ORF type:complete len:426 (+),score=73.27 TRINITY_DN325_c0_g1_i10:2-1279(+)
MARVEAVNPIVYEVTMGEETESGRMFRRKRMAKAAEERNLNVDVAILESIWYDPDMCKQFVMSAFNKTDASGTGSLDESEFRDLFTELTSATGLPNIPRIDVSKMFSVMKGTHDEVTFDQIFPFIRIRFVKVVFDAFLYPETQIEPETKDEKRDQAARKLQRCWNRYLNVRSYKKRLELWKQQEEARRMRISDGVAGSIRMAIDKEMKVHKLQADGPAEAAGIKVGDILLVVQRIGRGGASFNHPLRSMHDFGEAVGPQSEVFCGTAIKIYAATTDEQKKKWMNSASESDSTLKGWMARVEAVSPIVYEVTLGVENEDARMARMEKMATAAKGEGMNVDVGLLESFWSDPNKCKQFVMSAFNKTDASGTGSLDESEFRDLFTELTSATGLPNIPRIDVSKMFSVMKGTHDEVTFDQIFPFIPHRI